jgi:hypothetical protein
MRNSIGTELPLRRIVRIGGRDEVIETIRY